jgi:four helix bundle protein
MTPSYEKLDCYKVAVELRATVTQAIGKRGSRDLRDQFGRASSSVVLNIAEGSGRWDAADKRRVYLIARGSAFEVTAVLTLLRAESALSSAQYAAAKQLAIRVMAMLTNLAKRPVADAEVGR